MTIETPGPPLIAAAAALLREDGQLLLVRHRPDDGEFGGRWSLPMQAVPDEEVAEDTLRRVLRERLHVQPGPFEFAETIYLSGAAGSRHVVNLFTCVEWEGEPRYSEQHYDDAAWVQPSGHVTVDLLPGVSAWLRDAFGGAASALTDTGALASSLEEARRELLEAYESIATEPRAQPRHDGWSPLDVLSHIASVETYYAAEARRLLETPGHSWRGFNPAQWEDDHRSRPPSPAAEARSRLDAARRRTLEWLRPLSEEQLALYGNHPERGAVTIGDRVDKIARHDREHIEQLREMAREAGRRRSNSAAAPRGEKMLLLIDNYDSFTFNLYQYLSELGAEVTVVRNDEVSVEDCLQMAPERIVISPGPCTPKEAGISVELIRAAAGTVPLLGVCLGHQCIGEAFGGEVVSAGEILHGKTSMVTHDGRGVFEGLPDPFEAIRYHSLAIDADSVPEELEVTAQAESGVIMGVRHRTLPVEGVQFHPESIVTAVGHDLLRNFLRMEAAAGAEGAPS